jgi:hypothetical protein
MQASSVNSLVRALLALLMFCGSASAAVHDLTAGGNPPAGAGVQKGGDDGVGGIDYKPRPRMLPGWAVSGTQLNPNLPPLIEPLDSAGSGPWTDLGYALAGGEKVPELLGLGSGEPSTEIGLLLGGGPSHGTAMMVLGLGTAEVPFHGGLLVPRPDLILTGLPLDADGQLAISTVLPAQLPPDLVIYMQVWMPDATSPTGWSASNALKLITP